MAQLCDPLRSCTSEGALGGPAVRRSIPRLFLLLAALPALAFAPVPKPKEKPDPGKEDLKRLQGEWEMLECSVDGQRVKVRPGEASDVFKGDQLMTLNRGEVVTRSSITLDARKSPRRMDVKTKGGNLLLAIYRLEGDTLTLCYKDEPGAKGHPADF